MHSPLFKHNKNIVSCFETAYDLKRILLNPNDIWLANISNKQLINLNVFDENKHTRKLNLHCFLFNSRDSSLAFTMRDNGTHIQPLWASRFPLKEKISPLNTCCSQNNWHALFPCNLKYPRRGHSHHKWLLLTSKRNCMQWLRVRRSNVISCFVRVQNLLSNCKKPFKGVTYHQNSPSVGSLVDYIYMVTKQLLCSCDQFLCSASMHKTVGDTMMSRHPLINRRAKGKYWNTD